MSTQVAERRDRRWRGRAFGICVDAAEPIPGVRTDVGDSDRPLVRWDRVPSATLDACWDDHSARPLVHLRHPDGRLFLRVDHGTGVGYRVEAPGYGVHLVSESGERIASALDTAVGRRWQRLFFAQALPLAAASAGLDLLHASAVAFGSSAFAFVAPSGTGKTSIAVHLLSAGAELVTDDVLALELRRERPYAHPGAGTASVHHHELHSLGPVTRERVVREVWDADDGKVQIDAPSAAAALPMRALFFLCRDSSIGRLTIRREAAVSPARLLGTAFLPYLRAPVRLSNHLSIAASIAAHVPVYTVSIPLAMTAQESAARIHAHGVAEGLWT